MKKKTIVVVSLMLVAAIMLLMSACGDKVKYTVTVTGGNGSGAYEAGAECTVTAEVPDGKEFVRWTVDGEEVSTANPYTFKVTADAALTAVTADAATYTVSVTGGVITGTKDKTATVYEGATVSVTAPNSQSRVFKSWLINDTETSTANPYVFTATEDTKIVAIVDEVCLVAVSGGKVDGEIRKKFITGEECTIVADEAPEGQSFSYWYVIDENEQPAIKSRNANYTFNVTESEKYYAKFGFVRTITVNGGFVSSEQDMPTVVTLTDGDTCTVKPTVPADKVFVEWRIDGQRVSTSAEYFFEVKADVTLEAIFRDVTQLSAPANDNNEMLRHKGSYIIELDRSQPGGTVFNGNVDHVMFYIYTSQTANKSDYVGRFVMKNESGWQLATVDGRKVIALEGQPGNFWKETRNPNDPSDIFGDSSRLTQAIFSKIMELFIGSGYSGEQKYYLAAQACATEGSGYVDSEISAIGSQSFVD